MGRQPKTSRTETTLAKRAQVWTRYLDSHKYASISRLEGVPYSTVRDIIQYQLESGDETFKSKLRSGGLKKTSIRDGRKLVRYTIQYPRTTLDSLAILSKSGHKLHRNTVYRILKSFGKAKYKPRMKLYLKTKHRQ